MKFYRYEAVQYAEHDENDELCSPKYPNPILELRTFDLIKETPKGYWIGWKIGIHIQWKQWVPKESKRRYAYPSKNEALVYYIKRTECRLKILDKHIISAKLSLMKAKQLIKNEN